MTAILPPNHTFPIPRQEYINGFNISVAQVHDTSSPLSADTSISNSKKVHPQYFLTGVPFLMPPASSSHSLIPKALDEASINLASKGEAFPQMHNEQSSTHHPTTPTADRLEKETSDFILDKEGMERRMALRVLRNESFANNLQEVSIKQQHKKELHAERNTLLQYLEEQGELCKKLKWAKEGSTFAFVGIVGLSIAAAIVTGGFSIILGALSGVAAATSTVISGTSSLVDLQTQEKQGLSLELQEKRGLEQNQIKRIMADNQAIMQFIHTIWMLCIQIQRNFHQTALMR